MNGTFSAFDIAGALREPLAAVPYAVGEQLARLFPGRALIEGDACSFSLVEFTNAGNCTLTRHSEGPYNQLDTDWAGSGRGTTTDFRNVHYAVEWQGHSLDVVIVTHPDSFRSATRYYILAEEVEIAKQFLIAVCDWGATVRGEVLVFDSGRWQKSKELHAAIRNATFDNLVLPPLLKDEVRQDLQRFFQSRETYAAYGVPWKRGILLIGPPGNGKTHTVKAIINESGVPCLYVKSFQSQHATPQSNIRQVFQRARETTPCILVFEDLDSLIDASTRAFFLNELDGFAANEGIVTLATTNHPDRLDTAIVDRPSRFDRKYHFDLPGAGERLAYIALWNQGLQPDLQLTENGMAAAARETDGFSFAYLKELFVSAIMRWINLPQGAESRRMDAVLLEQITTLQDQMRSMNTLADIPLSLLDDELEDDE